MISLKIEDLRRFTSELFIGAMFDRFLMKEAVVTTFNTFTVDGRVHREYYTDLEKEEGKIPEYSAWETVKPFCFSLVKGKKLPVSFKIVLQLSSEDTEAFLARRGLAFSPEQVKGLYVNLRYEEGQMRCVSGNSVNFFTLDKSLEAEWDKAVEAFFRSHKIPVVKE